MPIPKEAISDWVITAFTSGYALWAYSVERRLHKINELIKQKEEREHITQDGEPVPPDPRTATAGQIATYKEAVLRGATSPPGQEINPTG